MMKKLTAVSVVLILMLALFTSCDKKEKNDKGDNFDPKYVEESESETDYRVKVEPEAVDEGCTITRFKCSNYESVVLSGRAEAGEICTTDDETGKKIRLLLDIEKWKSEDITDSIPGWFDYVIVFKNDDIYYIAAADKRAVYKNPDGKLFEATVTDNLLELLEKKLPGRIEKYEVDEETGWLTGNGCEKYAKKCLEAFVNKVDDTGLTGGFTKNDDPGSYIVDIRKGESEKLVNVRIEKPGNPVNYYYFEINYKTKGVLSGMCRSYDGKRMEHPDKLSYEGIEIVDAYSYNNINIESDGHFEYSFNDVSGNLVSISAYRPLPNQWVGEPEQYKPEPVEDIEKDAKEYLNRLYPGLKEEIQSWEVNSWYTESERTIRFTKKINGSPEIIAAFSYDTVNRFAGANLFLNLLKSENDSTAKRININPGLE